jgi:hypothetical protein
MLDTHILGPNAVANATSEFSATMQEHVQLRRRLFVDEDETAAHVEHWTEFAVGRRDTCNELWDLYRTWTVVRHIGWLNEDLVEIVQDVEQGATPPLRFREAAYVWYCNGVNARFGQMQRRVEEGYTNHIHAMMQGLIPT